jgi:hypothetical protein
LRGWRKNKLLVYDYGYRNHNWGRRDGLDLGLWLHIWLFFGRNVRDLCLFHTDIWFFTYYVAVIVYLFNVEVFIEATLASIGSNAHITLSWDISFLESARTVKLAIYLVFCFGWPNTALNFVFLIRYKDNVFLVSLLFREPYENFSAEVVISSVSTQEPAESCLSLFAFVCILGFRKQSHHHALCVLDFGSEGYLNGKCVCLWNPIVPSAGVGKVTHPVIFLNLLMESINNWLFLK